MKYAILLLAFIALPAFAAESKHDKDVRECRKATIVMKSPTDAKKAKQDAFNACMAQRGKIRAK